MPSNFGKYYNSPYLSTDAVTDKESVYSKFKSEPVSSCRHFVVNQSDKVQFNVAAYMYYKGKRLTKVVDEFRKDLHDKLTKELYALNMGLEGADHYAYVSICSTTKNS